LKDGFVVNTILKEADLFCPNSVRINFTIYLIRCCVRSGLNCFMRNNCHLHLTTPYENPACKISMRGLFLRPISN
ncbi:hypothetical protein EFT52_02480, partial [Lacticaseibacillus paracasei]|nr:hypothetical protein [Lacticaseibacillus paracasei]